MKRSIAGIARGIVGLLVCVAHAGAAHADGLSAAVWPMLGSAPSHSSLSTFRGPDTSHLAWRFATRGAIEGGVAIDVDGTLFFGNKAGELVAVDPTGVVRWRTDRLTPVIGVPALAQGGKLYAGAWNGTLNAFDVTSGRLLWSLNLRTRITTSPAVGSDGNVYIGTRRGLIAVSPQGTLVWTAPVRRIKGSSPAIGPDGTIYVATSDGRVVALSHEGAIVWQRDLGGRSCAIVGSLAIRGDRLYVGAADGNVRALDRASGNVVWAYQSGSPIKSGVSLGPDGAIHFGTADGRVLSVVDGGAGPVLRWARFVGGEVLSTPAVDRNGTVYVGSNDYKVYALAAADGSVRWTYATSGRVRSAIAIGIGGQVFAGSNDRVLYALGARRVGADCWSDAYIDVAGLDPDEVVRRFQVLLAACGGPGLDACAARVQGAINADRFLAAQRIAAQQFSPAQYLALLRDRTRKQDLLRADGGVRFCELLGHDADGDLVADERDACPGTPLLTPTDDAGCTDPTLPEAPPASLVRTALESANLLLDPGCDATSTGIPAITGFGVEITGSDVENPTAKSFLFTLASAPTPGCGSFFELEVVYRRQGRPDESHYVVFPSTRGAPLGTQSFEFVTRRDDPGTYGAFTRSTAFVSGISDALTYYRMRSTTYSGVRSEWSSLKCFECEFYREQ